MKRRLDLMRDVLFDMEKFDLIQIHGTHPDYSKYKNDGYSEDDVIYNISLLYKSGLITVIDISHTKGIGYMLCDITPYGHEFIELIRNDNTWNKIKPILEKLAGLSVPYVFPKALEFLSSLAKGVF